jgi:hypothetical protein
MKMPEQVPAPGFYYHYKHDDEKGYRDFAYEVLGTGCHTEEEGAPMVVYRPLYTESNVYQAGKLLYVRPLSMWDDVIDKGKGPGPRFSQITNPELISILTQVRDEMYSI